MNRTLLAHFGLLFANLLWAFNYPLIIKVLPHYISPLAMSSLSIFTAAIVLQIVDLAHPRMKVEKKDILKLCIAGVLMSFVRKYFLLSGIVLSSPISAAIIATLSPILVLIISLIMGREPLRKSKIIGIILGLIGAVIMVLFSSKRGGGSDILWGNFSVLISILGSSIYLIFFRDLIVKYPPTTILKLLYGFSSLIIAPFVIPEILETKFDAIPHTALFPFFYALTATTIIPNLLLSYSVKFLAPTTITTYNYLQPVVATVAALVMGVDSFKWQEGVAVMLIFGAVWLVDRKK